MVTVQALNADAKYLILSDNVQYKCCNYYFMAI